MLVVDIDIVEAGCGDCSSWMRGNELGSCGCGCCC